MPKRPTTFAPTHDPRELLPLTPVVLHILLAVADGSGTSDGDRGEHDGKHGYAVAQEVEELTGGQIRMGPGTLYGSLQRMLAASLIEEAQRPKSTARARVSSATTPEDDARRRYYRLTSLGRRVLELELARLAQVVAVARRKHLVRGADPEPA